MAGVSQNQELRQPAAMLEVQCSRWVVWLDHYRLLVLAGLSILYFAGTLARAQASPFWHDELYTLYLSRLSLGELWRALAAGADASPPFSYWIIKGAHALIGEGEIASRIPSVFGFWVYSLALYNFVYRRLGVSYALAAFLMPVATAAYGHAYEARCYSLLLGCAGMALVCWQAAAERPRRPWSVVGLALSLAGVTLSHYYGILIYLPLAGAELWKWAMRRKWDLPVATAMAAGFLPFVLCYPLTRALQQYVRYSWAEPRPAHLILFFENELGLLVPAAVVFLALASIYLLFASTADRAPVSSAPAIPSHELVLALLLTVVPIAGWMIAFLVTHMYSDRYFLIADAGILLLVVFMVSHIRRTSAVPAFLLLIAVALPFAFSLAQWKRHAVNPVDAEPILRSALAHGPVVIDDPLLFFQVWHYLPSDQKNRVTYLTDPVLAAKYKNNNSLDINFLIARRWIGEPAVPFADVATPGATFLLYHDGGDNRAWLLDRLVDQKASLELLGAAGGRSLLKVTVNPLQ